MIKGPVEPCHTSLQIPLVYIPNNIQVIELELQVGEMPSRLFLGNTISTTGIPRYSKNVPQLSYAGWIIFGVFQMGQSFVLLQAGMAEDSPLVTGSNLWEIIVSFEQT